MHTNRGEPTPPIAFGSEAPVARAHVTARRVEVDDALAERLAGACTAVTRDPATLAEASRDWWPLAMHWARDDEVVGVGALVARPADAAEVAAVLRICNEARVPVTPAAGRSGVCGGSAPVHGGVVLDLCALQGIEEVDPVSKVVAVRAGTFGDVFEDELRTRHGLTCGHWPQSIALSTVGGWIACRGAGQLSTRYGKIEDIVTGLDVVLADGSLVRTGGWPRAASGPDLTQLFVGSEGTLGVITGARLRAHRAPTHDQRAAYAFDTFGEALDAMRRILQRHATPAVLRLYDPIEAKRSYDIERAVLLVLDEGDPVMVSAVMQVVAEECATADDLDTELLERWLGHRNDVSALQGLVGADIVVDTMEISAPWAALERIYERTTEAIRAVPHVVVASAHQSHSYPDGGCLYFTFAARPPFEDKEQTYRAMWDAGTRAVLAEGGALSHHHGVGLNRGRFMREALGAGFEVLAATKAALDPNGILNPGKLGLPDPFGAVEGW